MLRTLSLAGLLLALCPLVSLAAQDTRFDVTRFGSFGADVAANTAVIQKAVDACAAAGGGTVFVPGGLHVVVGSIVLRSHVDLHLGRGAVLKASPNVADFTATVPYPVTTEPGQVAPPTGVVIFADGADDVAISGAGTIDGNSPAYVVATGKEIDRAADNRPFTVLFRSCTRATLRDFTIHNAAFWTIRILGCDDVRLSGLHIDNSLLMPNNDGIDIDWSSNVRISDCNIVSGDDCISLKTAPQSCGITRPCENVVITGCTLKSRSSGIVVGCDVMGRIRNVVCSDCVIHDSHRGVSVRLSMEGSIEHVLFSNMQIQTRLYDPAWWGRGTPIDIVDAPWNAAHCTGVIRDIRFSNLSCRGENGVVVYGSSPGLVEGIAFDHVSITLDKTTSYAGGREDFRPTVGDAMPEMPYSGFLLRNAVGVELRDCSVAWGAHRPAYYRYAIDAEHCPDLKIEGFSGHSADPDRWPAQFIR